MSLGRTGSGRIRSSAATNGASPLWRDFSMRRIRGRAGPGGRAVMRRSDWPNQLCVAALAGGGDAPADGRAGHARAGRRRRATQRARAAVVRKGAADSDPPAAAQCRRRVESGRQGRDPPLGSVLARARGLRSGRECARAAWCSVDVVVGQDREIDSLRNELAALKGGDPKFFEGECRPCDTVPS